jgi:hypothetical protein
VILGTGVCVFIVPSWNLTAVIPPRPFLGGLLKTVSLPVVGFIGEGVGAVIDTCGIWREKAWRNFMNLS